MHAVSISSSLKKEKITSNSLQGRKLSVRGNGLAFFVSHNCLIVNAAIDQRGR